MSDPLRTDPPSSEQSAADRDAKIEQLLLTGLDHYFDGQYDQAINVWTRALFIDRGHARARAYIERARSALAEQQRESEELLQRGLAAFSRGASDEARALLETALTRGAPPDQALAVLGRIQRLEPEAALASLPETPADVVPAERTAGAAPVTRTLHLAAWLTLAAAVVLATFVAAGAITIPWAWELSLQSGQGVAPTAVVIPGERALPLPRRGERALSRSRALAQSGRLYDALSGLDHISLTDQEKKEADILRADIQQQLLSIGRVGPGAPEARPQPSEPKP
jgi:hypothetical protein